MAWCQVSRVIRKYQFYTVDVFTRTPFGGNQLAVIPMAEGLSDRAMQAIAREFNLSETTFVLPPTHKDATRKVRIFTPGSELPFAGHPTLGTAYVLAANGFVEAACTEIVLEEGVGNVRVALSREGDGIGRIDLFPARLPELTPSPVEPETIAEILSIPAHSILDGVWAPSVASCGLPYLFITLRDRASVARVSLNRAAWETSLHGTDGALLYILCLEPELEGSHIRARMFAPEVGVEEDPATGSAAAALAGYLTRGFGKTDGVHDWVVEQGFEMARPSLLHVRAIVEEGNIVQVRVGGFVVPVSHGTIQVPEAT